MVQHERHERILAHLSEHDFLSVEEAVELLDSSPATVRRDFNVLAGRRLADRTRGGICRTKLNERGMMPFEYRQVHHTREKVAIAEAAASLIEVGDVVFVDGGTTTFQLAQWLTKMPVKCITTSLRLAGALSDTHSGEGSVEVFLTGGYLYPQSGLLIGPQAKASLDQYHARWAFISVAAISDDGIYNANELVVENERAMIANADNVVILADNSKIGTRSMCRIDGLDSVTHLVTDDHPSTLERLAPYRERGIEIVVAQFGEE